MSLLKEQQRVEYLEYLTIEISSGMVLEQLLSSHMLVKCIQKVGINNIGESTRVLKLPSCQLRVIYVGSTYQQVWSDWTLKICEWSIDRPWLHSVPCFQLFRLCYFGALDHQLLKPCKFTSQPSRSQACRPRRTITLGGSTTPPWTVSRQSTHGKFFANVLPCNFGHSTNGSKELSQDMPSY